MNISEHINKSRELLLDALNQIDKNDYNKSVLAINSVLDEMEHLSRLISGNQKYIEIPALDSKIETTYKFMVLRNEPADGYLTTYHLPTSIPDIIEDVGKNYGGGSYQIRIIDSSGRSIKSKSFIIAGPPRKITEN